MLSLSFCILWPFLLMFAFPQLHLALTVDTFSKLTFIATNSTLLEDISSLRYCVLSFKFDMLTWLVMSFHIYSNNLTFREAYDFVSYFSISFFISSSNAFYILSDKIDYVRLISYVIKWYNRLCFSSLTSNETSNGAYILGAFLCPSNAIQVIPSYPFLLEYLLVVFH